MGTGAPNPGGCQPPDGRHEQGHGGRRQSVERPGSSLGTSTAIVAAMRPHPTHKVIEITGPDSRRALGALPVHAHDVRF